MAAVHELLLHLNNMHTRITAVGDGVLRITHTLQDAFRPGHGDCVVDFPPHLADATENGREYTFTAGSVTLRIAKATGAFSFFDAAGNLLLREPERRPRVLKEKPVCINLFDHTAKVEISEKWQNYLSFAFFALVVLYFYMNQLLVNQRSEFVEYDEIYENMA